MRISSSTVQNVQKRDNHRCFLCRSAVDLEVHHIVPRSHFSKRDERMHEEYNLCLLCRRCHSTAHTTTSREDIINKLKVKQPHYFECYNNFPWKRYLNE
ncbi:MAG: hypothetical protein CMB80_05785 [Flammeovirgaceae bacterium]|nr:hypothetical protein [Flammeovirgaceae bacterium]